MDLPVDLFGQVATREQAAGASLLKRGNDFILVRCTAFVSKFGPFSPTFLSPLEGT
jgi:hypothetical protein